MFGKLCSLLLAMIASSLVLTATVHAREMSERIVVDCAGVVHGDGDADQSQGDSDEAVPHHHATCHGPTMNLANAGDLNSVSKSSGLDPFPVPQNELSSFRAGPALRPPAA
jgi:hypothetical protein